MRLVDKYLLRSFLAPLFYCVLSFIFIYIIIDLFGHLDEIIKEHVALRFLLIYYLAYAPSIITQIMPIAVLISTMYAIGGLAKGNEITALRASGISLWNILKPFLITGLLLAAFTLILNDTLVPKCTHLYLRIKEERIEKKKTAAPSAKLVKNVALYGAGNKIIYARSYDPKTKILKDIVIHEHDNSQNITAKIIANEARWIKNGWTAFNITSYKLDKNGQIKEEPISWHRGPLNIREKPEEFQRQKYKTEVLTLSELRTAIKRLSGTSGPVLQNLLVELHKRVAYPFANIIAVLIGAAFCLRSKRGGRLFGISLGFLIGLLFYGTFAVTTALGKNGVLFPFISAWFSNVVFGVWGVYLINKY